MKASLYFKYTTRSLLRGGQRTVLAVFCVAVGVMAIVSLQLVGLMINSSFTTNVRDANGGDIQVTSRNQPFTQTDLTSFQQLKTKGAITGYTPVVNTQGEINVSGSSRESFSVRVVDPVVYPLATPPTFVSPTNGSLATLLKHDQVVVTQSFADQYKKKIGDSFDIQIGSQQQSGRTIHAKLAGIVSASGILTDSGNLVLLSLTDYQSAAPKLVSLFDTIDVSAEPSLLNNAKQQILNLFPVANVQTTTDEVQQQQSTIDNIRKFLEIAGLLALLIGGVGIVNTMQVLLSRRKVEIAMLKTTGYRRIDLYLLFGLEAGLLGLVGGVIGALVATIVSYLIRNLVQQTFGLNISFSLDWFTLGGGVVIGLMTALIFGLLPIVQAANIRPLNVLRDLPEGRGPGSLFLTILLLIILSVLFCILSIVILNGDVILGISAVYGVFVFLGLLSLFFGLLILLLTRLPVLERFNIWYLLTIFLFCVLSVGLCLIVLPLGLLLLCVSLMGIVIVLLPRTWKATVKMSLRNLGRQQARTTTTMLSLFVGVFTIGLILVLGQDLRDEVNNAIANVLNYNVFTITSNADTTTLRTKLAGLPGLQSYQIHTLASTSPILIKNQSLQKILPAQADQKNTSNEGLLRQEIRYFFSGVEGYDVGNNQIPPAASLTITSGRNLSLSDSGTDNVLLSSVLAQAPLHLKVNDTITLTSVDRLHTRTVTVVGFYQASTALGAGLYPILGTTDTVNALSPDGLSQSIFYMKIDTSKLSQAVNEIGVAVPHAFVFNLLNVADFIDQLLNDILLTLTTIASLSLLAGVIIIANAVALAMLERRRELGILKSVGYTSGTLLSDVLLENGIVGGTAALIAVLLVMLIVWLLGIFFFKTSFGVNMSVSLALILGSALLAMLVAALVAWQAVRVRPLEVLRYE